MLLRNDLAQGRRFSLSQETEAILCEVLSSCRMRNLEVYVHVRPHNLWQLLQSLL